jgi:hypothetical protein
MRAVRPQKPGWAVVVLALVAATLVAPAFQALPAGAATLANVSWSVSNNQVNATAVTYGYSFKTATTGTIKTITFAVSGAGLAGTPAIARNYGIGAGSVARSGQTITYTVTSAVSVSSGIPIYVEFSGLTNTSTAGTYTTTITTQTSAPAPSTVPRRPRLRSRPTTPRLPSRWIKASHLRSIPVRSSSTWIRACPRWPTNRRQLA